MRLSTLALAALAIGIAAVPAKAQFSLVTVRANIAATDNIVWSQYGPAFTNVPNPSAGLSTGTLPFVLSKPSAGAFQRRDQGTGWAGNFAPGDPLIWNAGTGLGAITINFGANILFAAGLQVQNDTFGAYVAEIEALDNVGNVLFSSSLPGNASSAGDNSAVFIGVQSVSQPFAQIRFNVTGSTSFAGNQFDFRTNGDGGTAAPEPASLALIAVAGIGFLTHKRRK